MVHQACVVQDLGGGTIMPVEGVDSPLYALEVYSYLQILLELLWLAFIPGDLEKKLIRIGSI